MAVALTNPKLNALYASVGKSPALIDQEGYQYWLDRMLAGEDITDAFKESAATVYRDHINGAPSEYTQQNTQGFANLQDMMRSGKSDFYSSLYDAGMSPGQVGVIDGQPGYTGTGRAVAGGPSNVGTQGGWMSGSNPMLKQQIDSLGQEYTENLERNVLPAIRRRAIMSGGYGSIKGDVREGIAAGESQRGFARAATDLLYKDWGDNQNRGLVNQGQMLNFYGDQRSQDRQDRVAGAGLYDAGVEGPWKPIKNANSVYSSYSGFGPSTVSGSSGGGWLGAVGGAGAGYQLGNSWRW